QDRTGIPITLFINLLAALLLPGIASAAAVIAAILSAVETHVKRGSRRFTLTATTWSLINRFIAENTDFPYRRNYNQITTYHSANLSAGTLGMTFENRIYLTTRPQLAREDLITIFHEYVHTFQYKRYNQVVFIAVYVGEWLFELVRQRNPDEAYENIEFEDQAEDWAQRFGSWLDAQNIRFRPGANA
ncbi:MAG TPA: hypothetical protein VLF17_07855, partial [Candidatus Nitrosotenuis sp.]|nr:hypothetical protein [Candidatus Nitrosotenuis sp.]